MSEVRIQLERAQARFPAPDRVMDRLMDRRDRKRRNRRIVSAIVALALAGAALGGLLETFRGASERRPASNLDLMTPQNVSDLRLAWVGLTPHTAGSDQGISVAPVVEGNRVYVDSKGFFVYAFSTSCGSSGASCEPLWISLATDARSGDTPATAGIGGRVVWPPAAADARVFQSAVDQAVFAYPASCGSQAAACRPLWAGVIKGIPSSPVIAGNLVYVFSGGTVYAFPASCGTGGATCSPLWTGATAQKRTDEPARLAVADGVLYVTVGRALYAFSTTCGGSSCEPIWHTEQLGHGGPAVQTSPPIVGDGMVFVSVGSESGYGENALAAYSASCTGSCEPLWTWSAPGRGVSDPVLADGKVFLTEQRPHGNPSLLAFGGACRSDGGGCAPEWIAPGQGEPAVAHGVVYVDGGSVRDAVLAYRAGCASEGSPCRADRIYAGGSGEPVVAGDLLFVAPTNGHAIFVYDAGCADGGTCSPLWTATIHGLVRSGPVVTRDGVYVGTSDGEVVAFRLPEDEGGLPATAAAIGAVLLALVLLIGAVVGWRRRE
jgi:outer membrane protein assembly factor BamB